MVFCSLMSTTCATSTAANVQLARLEKGVPALSTQRIYGGVIFALDQATSCHNGIPAQIGHSRT